ncbi:serine/threonine-protein kinase [Pseudoxanthomonas broegbernensis]|nr:serine/threonine-protein kinase [Pseudoxanthomonas broegbernensis]MBB6065786.1 serine/threonine-protein kinase [Pseudoxanthomonas broegbernensis]
MDAEALAQWRIADALFDQWLDLPEAGRDAWLAAQAPDPPVRRRLERMIAAHRRPDAALDARDGGLAGRRFGDWTLEEELGRGGMAVVHRAWREQGMARQQAAVKVLTLGALGATGRERFQREAQILARLNHPNVTALVDSGVAEDGTCWLAIPLVEGERIDRWCAARGLDARTIVRLYLQVCDAAAYAHRNLVIHRDLKPSNVLVDAGGHVRLLDFGIGQFADAGGERTQTLWRALTPGYAAPEQLRGAPPTTAVDVYGLGALLHRLLTGRAPQGTAEGAQTTRPSLLVRSAGDAYHRHYVPLRNDLDRVLLKALAEEPGQRYPSAEALAADLRRWLEGRPILAQKPRLGYRLRKFVLRNTLGVATACLLAATVAAGIGATVWQADLARREAAHARDRAQRAEAVRDFLGNAFVSTRPAQGRVPDMLEVVAASARGARETLAATDPLAAADVLLLTGTVRANLDAIDEAEADLRQALGLLAPHEARAASELSRAHWELGRIARHRGDRDAAREHIQRTVALNALWDAPANERIRARISLGETLLAEEPARAEALFREIVAEIQGTELEDSLRHLNALNGLSIALATPGHDARTRLPIQEERLRIARKIYDDDSGGYAFTLTDVTHTFAGLGMFDRAEALAREAVAVADRTRQRPAELKAMTRCNLALVLQQRGRLQEALPLYDAGNTLLLAGSHQGLATERCFRGSAYVRAALGQHRDALDDLRHAGALLARHRRTLHPDALAGCGLAASVHLRGGDRAAAAHELAQCTPPDGADPPLALAQARAELLLAQGDTAGATCLAAELRGRHRPAEAARDWMRPWMLSMLLARQAGDAAAQAALATEASGFLRSPPLAACFAAPTEADCLALP